MYFEETLILGCHRLRGKWLLAQFSVDYVISIILKIIRARDNTCKFLIHNPVRHLRILHIVESNCLAYIHRAGLD